MILSISQQSAEYQAFKNIMAALSTPRAIFYGLNPSSGKVDVAYALFTNEPEYVSYDMRWTTNPAPTEATFLADFPIAVKGYINSVAY